MKGTSFCVLTHFPCLNLGSMAGERRERGADCAISLETRALVLCREVGSKHKAQAGYCSPVWDHTKIGNGMTSPFPKAWLATSLLCRENFELMIIRSPLFLSSAEV